MTLALEITQGQGKHASGGVDAKPLGGTQAWRQVILLTAIIGALTTQSVKACAQRGIIPLKRHSQMNRASVSCGTTSQGLTEVPLESQQETERKIFKGILPTIPQV